MSSGGLAKRLAAAGCGNLAIRRTSAAFRGPAFEGDATFIEGEVVDKIENSEWHVPVVQVRVTMTNQEGKTLVTALNEIEPPH
jgi:acyl dehydratase